MKGALHHCRELCCPLGVPREIQTKFPNQHRVARTRYWASSFRVMHFFSLRQGISHFSWGADMLFPPAFDQELATFP